MARGETPIEFEGDSLESIKSFPAQARIRTGFELGELQEGKQPHDFKPIKTVGDGVYELRVSAGRRAFRTFYITKVADVIYVLHAFEKKSRKTSPRDLEKGKTRYKALVKRLQSS